MNIQDLNSPNVPLDSDERECESCGVIYFIDEFSGCDCEAGK